MADRLAIALVVWAILSTAAAAATAGEHSPPAVGGGLPEFTLPPPADAGKRAYLGLAEGRPFSIPEIKAEVVVVEVFNRY
jgi:hypothetical protein